MWTYPPLLPQIRTKYVSLTLILILTLTLKPSLKPQTSLWRGVRNTQSPGYFYPALIVTSHAPCSGAADQLIKPRFDLQGTHLLPAPARSTHSPHYIVDCAPSLHCCELFLNWLLLECFGLFLVYVILPIFAHDHIQILLCPQSTC